MYQKPVPVGPSAATSPEERQALILQRVLGEGRVQAGSLAAEFGVSEDSIRRDLREMSERGLVHRVHGGAIRRAVAAGGFGERRAVGQAAKAALAEAALMFLRPGITVLLDQGTTTLALAQRLPLDNELVVVTPTPEIALAAMDRGSRDVILLGGRMDRASRSCAGPAVLTALEGMRLDLCVLGVCGIEAEIGATVGDHDEAQLKRAMVRASSAVLTLVTSEKLGTALTHRVAPLSRIDRIVTEASVAPERLRPYRDAGIDITLA
jgi:DeoR/GlpR family transcriptional regulator of sugar metabolism